MKSILLTCFALLASLSKADIYYRVTPEVANRAILVSMQFEAKDQTELKIPAWCPGFYVIQDFSQNVYDLKVTDSKGHLIRQAKPSSDTWKLSLPKPGLVTVSYRVHGNDPGLGFFAVHVNDRTSYINGPAAFLYVEGRKTERCHLQFQLPSGWRSVTAMDLVNQEYQSADYDEFVDHPIQLGKFDVRKFTVEGIPFTAAFVGKDELKGFNLDAESLRIASLAKPAIKMMGKAGFKQYVVIFHLVVGNFSGGLEHRGSHVEAIAPSGTDIVDDSLFTHEFFHAWNVKQIRPRVLGPFNYQATCRTNNLWFSEGVTDYYADIHAYRSGLQSATWLLEKLSEEFNNYDRSNMAKNHTVEDASHQIWEYGGISMGDFSFYNKGLLAGFFFDAAIRSGSGGNRSLDDVLRGLYGKYALPNPGFGEDDLKPFINQVAGSDISDLYETIIRTTNPLPFDLLKGIGLKVVHGNDGFSVTFDEAAGPEAAKRRSEWLSRP